MKILIAIVSCHAFSERRDAIRETWKQNVPPYVDCKFFLGVPNEATFVNGLIARLKEDEIALPVDDSYRGLPEKTRAIARYALEHGYTHVFKCDDDTYVEPKRLVESDFAQLGDYVGRKRGPSGNRPAPYASGFSYWMNRRAMSIVTQMDTKGDTAEDRCVGNALLEAGVQCVGDYRYVVIDSRRNAVSHTEGPRHGNTVISACEFSPEAMKRVHQEWLTLKAGEPTILPRDGKFSKVCVMVKTFMRDGYLLKSVEGLQKTMPEAKIVIVDDGRESSFKISWYANLRRQGHVAAWLPFDSGFGAKANEAIKHCDRPYVLIASDDFDFADPAAAEGVGKLIRVLECDSRVHVASGRVNGNPYEATLELKENECIERRGYYETRSITGVRYHVTDLTVNYSLIRREVFEKIKWDDDVKIGGGEHGAFYIDLKRAGFQVAWVEDVNIKELRGTTDWSSVEYHKFRGRARQPGRICLKRRGVDRYHLMGGECELT